MQRDDTEGVGTRGEIVDVFDQGSDGFVTFFFGVVAAEARVNKGYAEEVDDGKEYLGRELRRGGAHITAEGVEVREGGLCWSGFSAGGDEIQYAGYGGVFCDCGAHLGFELAERWDFTVENRFSVCVTESRQCKGGVWMWGPGHANETLCTAS